MNQQENPATAIAWKLRDIQHRHMLMIHSILDRHSLHCGQPRILHTVADMDGASQREIADKLQISPASLAMSIKRMCKAGLLEKVASETDQRTNQIRITPKGMQQHIDCLSECAEADARMLEGLSQAEIGQLGDILSRIYDNLIHMTVEKDA
ncbi:MAG: MarR family winged helix-turn-helix transcriptional regulator [Armatimonadota bacterium]